MSIDYSKLNFLSSLNTFKNTGVFSTSLTTPSSLGAGATSTVTSTVTLTENQVFALARAQYTEFAKTGAAKWQLMPTFDATVQCTTAPFVGPLNYAIFYTINGTTVTFTGFIQNPYGSPISLTQVTIPISYVTYTIAK